MKLSICTLALLCGSLTLSAAEPLFKGTKLSDFQGLPLGKAGMSDGILKIEKNDKHFVITTKKSFPVDPEKAYEFSCQVRADEKVSKASFRGLVFGAVCYDKKGKRIPPMAVLTKPQLTAELAAPVKAGDKTILVKEASLWAAKNGFVAFSVKKDMSDLPNSNVIGITKIEKKNNLWEITLARSVKTAFPAKSLVRNHFDGSTYLYAAGPVFSKDRWVTVKMILKSVARQGEINAGGKFRAGTAAVGIVFLTGPKLNEVIEIKDIRITPVK